MKERHFKRKVFAVTALTLALMIQSVSPVIAEAGVLDPGDTAIIEYEYDADSITNNLYAAGITTGSTNTVKNINFTDLRSSHWAYNSIKTLVSLGGIKGYPDGSFRPEGSITYAELSSILLGATGHDNTVSSGTSWSKGILQKAYDAKIIDSKTVPLGDANAAVTRGTMAMMLSNSAEYLRGEDLTTLQDISKYLRDWNAISPSYQEYVNQCVASGLIQGDSSSNFKATSKLTRAEASTICLRLIDKSVRVTPTKFNDSYTQKEKKDATADKLAEYGVEITRYITAQQFIDEFGVGWQEGVPNDGYKYITLEKETSSMGVVVNSEYVGTDDNYLKNLTDDTYELKGDYIAKYCTGLTVRDPGTGSYLVVVGNPFAILGL